MIEPADITHERVITGDVVHAKGSVLQSMLLCGGRVASSNMRTVFDGRPVTCFWCITRTYEPTLRWFKWGDGT